MNRKIFEDTSSEPKSQIFVRIFTKIIDHNRINIDSIEIYIFLIFVS